MRLMVLGETRTQPNLLDREAECASQCSSAWPCSPRPHSWPGAPRPGPAATDAQRATAQARQQLFPRQAAPMSRASGSSSCPTWRGWGVRWTSTR